MVRRELFFFLIHIILLFPSSSCSDNGLCSPFKCGDITFSFPFSNLTFASGSTLCGLPGYQITCDSTSSLATLLLSGRSYQIKNFYPSDRLLTVVDIQLINDLSGGSCRSLNNRTTFSESYNDSLQLPVGTTNLSLYQCPNNTLLSQGFLNMVEKNYSCSEGSMLYLWQSWSQLNPSRPDQSTPHGCKFVIVPAVINSSLNLNTSNLELVDTLRNGFPLGWPVFRECENCEDRRCGYDSASNQIVCLTPTSPTGKGSNLWKIIVGIAGGGCFIILIAILIAFRRRILQRCTRSHDSIEGELKAKQFIQTYQSSLITIYSYNDIKKIADGFREKLGSGGYGNVYKGRLQDGRLVAVKLLDKSGNIGQDFSNEVATIGRIHHVNVINLLGFSWDGKKQALIYEFMENGSLADLLSDQEMTLSLGLARLLEIAVGIGRGIEYLHNGCESRILHLDIKPQNVLLDRDLNPKISDFGLAKIYSRSKSAITMTNARGTIGYVAPELFMRNLGSVSHKSDVYSYGMLLLEITGHDKHFSTRNLSHSSSELYFPGSVYDRFITESNDAGEVEDEESNIAKKIVMVAMWCIQMNPRERPSMTRVLEMLCGDLEGIEVPSKPFFFSLPRVNDEIDISTTSSWPLESNNTIPIPVSVSSSLLHGREAITL